MIHLFDTRWATYEQDGSIRLMTEAEKADRLNPMPRYWVQEDAVQAKLSGRWDADWLLGWRDIARATDARTVITTKLPRLAFGNKIPLILPATTNDRASLLQAALSSFVLDFTARQKVGGITLNYFIMMQLPVPSLERFSECFWLGDDAERWFARRVGALNGGRLKPEARAATRAELDAALFHIYGLDRAETDYAMDTFPIVKREDEATHGFFLTKKLIMAAYDNMSTARGSGGPYRSPWRKDET